MELKKDVAVHRSLISDKVGSRNPSLAVSRDLDINFTN